MRLNDEQRKLAEDNLQLVYLVLHKYVKPPRGAEFDDYIQEGRIGLCKAAFYFNPELGYTFSTYAISMISGEIRRYRRDYGTHHDMFKIPRKTRNEILESILDSFDLDSGLDPRDYNKFILDLDYTFDSDGKQSTLAEVIEDTRAGMSHQSDLEGWEVIQNAIDKTIARLSRASANSSSNSNWKVDMIEEYLYSLIYGGEKLTQTSLGKKYGRSQAQVARVIGMSLKYFKQYYEQECNNFNRLNMEVHNNE